MELFWNRLGLFFARLGSFFEKILAAPESMWRQTAGEPGNRVMLLVFALAFAIGALYLVISFLRAGWREKGKMLLTALFCALVLLLIFYFALM